MTSTASPDPTFQQLMVDMLSYSASISDYLRGVGQRKWMIPTSDWGGDLTDLETIKQAFDRSFANEAYTEALNNGTSGAAAAQNLQIAYISTMERAFRVRHLTPCRAAVHAAGRRYGHGQAGGVHIGQVLQFVQDLLAGSKQQ